MALTTCPDCGNRVSTEAEACPRCGRPGPFIASVPSPFQRSDATAGVPGEISKDTIRKAFVLGGIFLLCFAVFLGVVVKSSTPSGQPARIAPPDPLPTSTAAATAAASRCDAHARWFDNHLTGTPEENRAAFVVELKGWGRDCRLTAVRAECAHRCDEFVSDMLIDAAESSAEKAEIYRWRIDRNKESVAAGKAILAKVVQFKAYCQSIAGVPRGLTPECMSRMRADFEKIGELEKELNSKLAELPIGFVGLRSALSFAKGCVNCSTDDRWQCADMGNELKSVQENLTDLERIVGSDQKSLTRLQ